MSWVMAFMGQKGGTGKSRSAQAFATEAARAKLDVLLADMDVGPTSSSAWAEIRASNNIEPVVRVERVNRLDVGDVVGMADLVVLDTAGFADKITKEIAARVHLVVTPVGTDIGDWEPTRDLLAQLIGAGVSMDRLAIPIVKAASESTAELTRTWFVKAGFKPLKHETYFSAAYSHAFNRGLAMTECSSEAPRLQAVKQVRDIGMALERVQNNMQEATRATSRARAAAERGR